MRLVALVFFALVACDDFEPAPPNPDTDSDSGLSGTDGCGLGMARAADASLIISQLTVDGGGLVTDFVQGNVYDGVPAACTRPDATAFELIFEVGGQPFGSIRMRHNGPGSYDPNTPGGDNNEALLMLDLFGADVPTLYGAGDWEQSTWTVDTEDLATTSDFFGTAFSGGENTSINLTLSVVP